MRDGSRLLRGVVAALVALVLAGCVSEVSPPPPEPTSKPRAFTVGTTDQISVTDPAAITDAASSTVAYNVFQRLWTTEPGSTSPKPDAVQDCRFDSPTLYVCTLRKDLQFHNGHALTSSDVKFSIERALRLEVSGSSVSSLSSIRRIETPDDLTVRFILSRTDTEFVYGLASPAASIVDEEVYDPDSIRKPDDSMVGSGPFKVSFFNSEELQLARNDTYQGNHAASVDGLILKMYESSAELEEAMAESEVDVVWRGLNIPAVTRLQNQIQTNANSRTDSGFGQVAVSGARVRQLRWHEDSDQRSRTAVRKAVAGALQDDRVMATLVPRTIEGSKETFDIGAGAKVSTPWKQRIKLTLAYDPTAPDAADQANQIRARLEDRASMSVQLVKATPVESADADLMLVDYKAWTPTGMAWLQPYLDQAIQSDEVKDQVTTLRETADVAPSNAALGKLQDLAAEDLVVLPIIQTDENVFVADGWLVDAALLAPGWQLGMWGFRRP